MSLFHNITHIIFDLDGLLIDSEPLWYRAEDIALQTYGKRWDMEIAKRHTGVRMDESAAIMIEGYGLDTDAVTLERQVIDEMLILLAKELIILPGADELIKQAHTQGLTLAIASSSMESYIQAVVDRSGWQPFISVIASAYNVPRGKPAPDVYLQAIELLGAQADQCIAFEDSVNGAKAARDAGMRCVAIPGHGFVPADYDNIAHHVYPSLLDVVKLLPH